MTVAERPLDPADFPGADPAQLVPGSLVFRKTDGPVDLRDVLQWWDYEPGVTWRDGPDDHPVTHVAFEDAETYAAWAGKAAAHRGRVGVRCPRRARGRGLRLG